MVHRIVVLPDYQGIGIGGAFLDNVAQRYSDKGFDFRIVTSARNFIKRLDSSKKWRIERYGIVSFGSKTDKTMSSHRKNVTGSFLYIANKGGVDDGKDGQAEERD